MYRIIKLIALLVISTVAMAQTVHLDGNNLKSNKPYFVYESGPTLTISDLGLNVHDACFGWGKGWGGSWHSVHWMDIFKETKPENLDLASYEAVDFWVDDMCQDDDANGGNGFFTDMNFLGFSYNTDIERYSINDCIWTINTGHTGIVEMNKVRGRFVVENDDDPHGQFWIVRYKDNYSEVSSHRFEVVEPIKFNSEMKYTYCQSDDVVNLTSFISNEELVIDGIVTIKIDGEKTNVLNPSVLSTSEPHTINISMEYDNGVYSRDYVFEVKENTEIIVNNLNTKNEVCLNSGIYNIKATPTGGSWSLLNGSASSISGNILNTDLPTSAGEYVMEYEYTNSSSCISSETITIVVNELPVISSVLNRVELCENGEAINLESYEDDLKTTGASSWSDLEELGSVINLGDEYTFNPNYAKKGNNRIRYNFVDNITGCAQTGVKNIVINSKPLVDGGSDIEFCEDAIPFTPTFTNPSGGEWSGEAFSNNVFYPTQMSSNKATGIYTYTDEKGCSNSDEVIFTKNNLPLVSHEDLEECATAGNITLSGGFPSGGKYSGSNVSLGIFNVNSVGSGSVNGINYEFTDEKGCVNNVDFNLYILDDVIVDAGPNLKACLGDVIKLTGMNPSNGGDWQQTYVLGGGEINTAELSVGTYTLDYSVNSTEGCTGIDSRTLEIFELPTVNVLGSSSNVCENQNPVLLDFGTPTGGSWSGQGVEFSSNSYFFNPSTSITESSNVLTYTYTDGKGCSNSDNISYYTRDIPNPTAVNSITKCINDVTFDLTPYVSAESTTNTVKFISPVVNGSIFDMNQITEGPHEVIFEEKNIYGCTSTVSTIVYVNKLPHVNAGRDTSFCENDGLVTIGDYSPSNAIWSPNNALQGNTIKVSAIESSHTILRLNYTDGNGCSNFDEVKITKKNKPEVTANLSEELCSNASPVKFSSGLPLGGYYYGKGIIGDTFYPKIIGNGVNIVHYTFSNEVGCHDTADISVVIHAPTTSNAGNDTLVCNSSEDINLNVYSSSFPNGDGQIWSMTPSVGILENTLRPDILNPGEYILYKSYTDGNNCITIDSLVLKVKGGLNAPSLTGDNNLCYGDTFLLSASVTDEDIDTRFKWYYQGIDTVIHTGKDFKITPSSDITIFVAAENGYGCPSVKTIHEVDIQRPNALINIANDTVSYGSLHQISLSEIQDVNEVLWTFEDNTTSNELHPYHYFYSEGVAPVKVILKSLLGCELEINLDTLTVVESNVIDVQTASGSSSNQGLYASSLINVYPNVIVNNEKVIIEYINDNVSDYDYKIYNINGFLVKEGNAANSLEFDNFSPGLYVLSLISIETGIATTFKINKQ